MPLWSLWMVFSWHNIKPFMRFFSLFLISCFIGLASCNHFEYSPDQVFDRNSYRDINARNLRQLGQGLNDDTVRFILTGDSQRSRDETVEFCKKVNGMRGIDFVILAGDISEFGVLKEMEWISRALESLKPPYVAVIGNHDMTSRGREVFQHMFGELNYSFVYGGLKFICHDTNGREYKFNGKVPDLTWISQQLQPEAGVGAYIPVSHVPPNSEDFDPQLKSKYIQTFAGNPGILTSLHAHTHNYDVLYPDESGIPYLITGAMGSSEFLLIEIVNRKLSFERVFF